MRPPRLSAPICDGHGDQLRPAGCDLVFILAAAACALILAGCGGERGARARDDAAQDAAAADADAEPDARDERDDVGTQDSRPPAGDTGAPPDADIATPETADGDVVSPECEWECSRLGATHCAGGGYRACVERDADPCFELGELVPCAAAEVCWDYLTNVTSGETSAYCQTACARDEDCAGAWGAVCDAALGHCVQCRAASDCQAFSPHFAVCSAGLCALCQDDEDCRANPDALGPRCEGFERKGCRCADDADCAGNRYGPHCRNGTCTCAASGECAAGRACQLEGWDSRRCYPACAADADCRLDPARRCDLASGVCGECLSDADCDRQRPLCHPETRLCVPCLLGADCAHFHPQLGACLYAEPNHAECVPCLEDADCVANPSAQGRRCEGYDCTCADDDDCAGLTRGPACLSYVEPGWGAWRTCGCVDDAQCVAPAACLPRLDGAVTTCRTGCGADADCADTRWTRSCDPDLALCVQCVDDADCGALDPGLRHCFEHACYQCTSDADCRDDAGAFGPTCAYWDTGPPTCACSSDDDCRGNVHGPHCIASSCGCSATEECAAGQICDWMPFSPFDTRSCQTP